MSAVNALAQAREDRNTFGMERRRRIRERVLEMKEAKVREEESKALAATEDTECRAPKCG